MSPLKTRIQTLVEEMRDAAKDEKSQFNKVKEQLMLSEADGQKLLQFEIWQSEILT